MGLELYARIEEYLDFEEEVRRLHKEFLAILFKKKAQQCFGYWMRTRGFFRTSEI